jgi:hypothetical protein|tara:strand:- start:3682 stop:4077 length:396 start_codon:yes stop_codon:yes gene_type:complete
MPTTIIPTSKRIKTSSAKAKGRKLQQWVRDYLHINLEGIEKDDVTSTPGGVNGPDIGLSPLARRLFPWTVECKARAAFSIYAALEQAERNVLDKTKPVAILRGDRKRPLALLYADDFMEIVTCLTTKKKKS